MTRAAINVIMLGLSLGFSASVTAEPNRFQGPHGAVSKGARPAIHSAAIMPPSPERFGPVRVTPLPTNEVQAQAEPTFAEPSATPKLAAEPSCELTSTLAGKEAKALIAKIALEEEFDLSLLNAIAKQESDFRMNQRSPAGALGLMQLMPATAKSLGVDPCIPDQNIRGSIKLLRLLDTKYNGNIIYILAAYNAGEDAVDRNGGIPPYRETITYVTRILSNLNGWDIPQRGKASDAATSQNTTDNEPPKPAANRWAQGFVLHVE